MTVSNPKIAKLETLIFRRKALLDELAQVEKGIEAELTTPEAPPAPAKKKVNSENNVCPLTTWRLKKGLSQSDAADQQGIARSTWSNLEAGWNKPTERTIAKLRNYHLRKKMREWAESLEEE